MDRGSCGRPVIAARRGVTPETRRHTAILSLLGIRHVILAINKMDLMGWSQSIYDTIAGVYRDYAQRLDLTDVTCIPVSALTGDNVTAPSAEMGWYHGPTLLQALESIDVTTDRESTPFRMPVQWVTHSEAGSRGFSGNIVSGLVRPGDPILVCPAHKPSTVSRIVSADGDLTCARPGQAVTLTLADDIDATPGDVIASTTHPPGRSDQFACHLIWMHENALLPKRSYLLKIGTNVVGAQITALKYEAQRRELGTRGRQDA